MQASSAEEAMPSRAGEPKSRLDYSALGWGKICLFAALAGVGGGAGAIIFRKMIEAFYWVFFERIFPFTSALNLNGFHFGLILMPILGGLIIGPIIFTLAREAKGHGVPEIIESVHFLNGVVRKRVAVIKIIVSSITLGSGGSAGREGPVAQIGGGVGSTLGQFFKLDSETCRLLTACGAAAGIAGTFNAPIGGAFFGTEIILRKVNFRYLIPCFIASVTGAWVASLVLGTRPAFQTTLSNLACTPADLISFVFLGLIFGVLSFIWVRVFYYVEDRFDNLRKVPDFLKVPIGMSVAGILTAVFAWQYTMSTGDSIEPMYYGIMGVGYGGMDVALMGKLSIVMLLLLSISKIIATSFTIGSGGSGGIFAPSLYIGTLFGLGCGYAFHAVMPSTNLLGSPLAYGIGGMAALFAGAARAPLTAMFQVPEMARCFELFPAIVIICVVSYIVSSLLLKGSSIYTIKLERRGRPPIDSAI